MTKAGWLQLGAWAACGTAVTLGFIAWGQTYGWQLSKIGVYQLFPLLGLVGYGVMWSHYVASASRQYLGLDKQVLQRYFELTAGVVLAAILLHPGLLTWQLWRDGQGLPPGSELNYVMEASRWAILFGFLAVSLFLLYELRRVYGNRPWWKFVQYGSDLAMILIFFHALTLGGALQIPWFRAVWYFYGLTLALSLVYTYAIKPSHKH